ncbi:hypothetical protein B0H13DRAFT_2380135 [Mycena leptocephala]|nr:hypothetical protein B0H13DRAFT_2380135 [Mycena leptocephala]
MSVPTFVCTPVFLPDPGHEDKAKHSASKDTWFYGVISKDWKGIVTSMESVDKLKAQDPDAHVLKARTWEEIQRLWDADCMDKHFHEGRPALPVVDIVSDSTLSRPASRAASPTKGSVSRAASPTKGARRPPSPTKARMAAGQKVGIQFWIPPFHAANHKPPCQSATFGPVDSANDTVSIAAKFEAWSGVKKADSQPLMFGVSGTNRIFHDRYRALAAFLETPGAELFFTYDEDAVLEFIEREAAEMLKKKGTA